jgi:hypothetical protein
VISGTRTGSPARQIAGSVCPKQPPGTLRSAHRTAAPRAFSLAFSIIQRDVVPSAEPDADRRLGAA